MTPAAKKIAILPPSGAIEGDALFEGDRFALDLYATMLKIRSENDIPEAEFQTYSHMREPTIEQPEEIWRNSTSLKMPLVTLVRNFEQENGDAMWYLITTAEESKNSHTLLFSFPTTDINLVERYRQGESLEDDENKNGSSH